MEIFVAVVGVIVVASVVYSAWTSSRAFAGVEFDVNTSAHEVARALTAIYSPQGAKGAVRQLIRGVRVDAATARPDGSFSFDYSTPTGDQGSIVVTSEGSAARVTARAESLFRGKKNPKNRRTGFYQLVEALTALTMKLLYIRPNAPKIMRFQNRLEGKINKQLLRRSA